MGGTWGYKGGRKQKDDRCSEAEERVAIKECGGGARHETRGRRKMACKKAMLGANIEEDRRIF
jgi:hypothetical protein